jgi:putative sterol carrier protein
LLGQPRPDDEIRGRWLVLGLAVTTKSAPSVPDGIYELRIDNDVLHVRTQRGHIHPAQGPAIDPDATIAMTTDTLVSVVGGRLDVATATVGQRFTIDGDRAGAQQLLMALSPSR